MITDLNYFDEEFFVFRKLATDAKIYHEYEKTWEHLNCVPMFDQVALVFPGTLTGKPRLEVIKEKYNNSIILDLIKFPEQLLGVNVVYVVETTDTGFFTNNDTRLNVRIITIADPIIISKGNFLTHESMMEESTLKLIETDVSYNKYVLTSTDYKDRIYMDPSVIMLSIYNLNIVPSAQRTYNAVFYERDSAETYACSLERAFRSIKQWK